MKSSVRARWSRPAGWPNRPASPHAWLSDHYHPWQESQGESAFVLVRPRRAGHDDAAEHDDCRHLPDLPDPPRDLGPGRRTTAALAPGRFRFGVGSGEALNEHILGEAWPPVSIRLERLEEAIEVMRKLWTGEVVTHQGRYHTVHNARIFSLPDEEIPVLISGFGPEATELAARASATVGSRSPRTPRASPSSSRRTTASPRPG